MPPFRTAGFAWIVAAVLAAVATVIFRVDQLKWVVTLVASAIALGVGASLVSRPSARTFLASSLAGLGWVALYLILAVVQSAEIAAWTTDAFLAAIGSAASVLAFWSKRRDGSAWKAR
jgi:hypothetical protein